MQSAGAVFLQEHTAGKKRFPLKLQIPPAQMHRGDFKYQKLLNVFDRVLEAVLFLQLLHLGLAVLDEGGGVDGSAIVGLLVVLNDLLQLCPALVGLVLVDAVGEVDDELAVFRNTCLHGRFSL